MEQSINVLRHKINLAWTMGMNDDSDGYYDMLIEARQFAQEHGISDETLLRHMKEILDNNFYLTNTLEELGWINKKGEMDIQLTQEDGTIWDVHFDDE